jgi:hypothetical protein
MPQSKPTPALRQQPTKLPCRTVGRRYLHHYHQSFFMSSFERLNLPSPLFLRFFFVSTHLVVACSNVCLLSHSLQVPLTAALLLLPPLPPLPRRVRRAVSPPPPLRPPPPPLPARRAQCHPKSFVCPNPRLHPPPQQHPPQLWFQRLRLQPQRHRLPLLLER